MDSQICIVILPIQLQKSFWRKIEIHVPSWDEKLQMLENIILCICRCYLSVSKVEDVIIQINNRFLNDINGQQSVQN